MKPNSIRSKHTGSAVKARKQGHSPLETKHEAQTLTQKWHLPKHKEKTAETNELKSIHRTVTGQHTRGEASSHRKPSYKTQSPPCPSTKRHKSQGWADGNEKIQRQATQAKQLEPACLFLVILVACKLKLSDLRRKCDPRETKK